MVFIASGVVFFSYKYLRVTRTKPCSEDKTKPHNPLHTQIVTCARVLVYACVQI